MIDQERFGIILSQTLNSIKHTPESFGNLYKIKRDEIIGVINGEFEPSLRLISILEKHPVIDITLFSDESRRFRNSHGSYPILLQSKEASNGTKRNFVRGNINYYTYKDLAASFCSPFLPEHITPHLNYPIGEELEIDNCYFNKGHLEHQITMFVGEVNFHWVIGGVKYIKHMNNLDFNYITPYVPHTFTTRQSGSFIVAITYKSLYSYLPTEKYKRFIEELMRREMKNNTPGQTEPNVDFWLGGHLDTPINLLNRVRTPQITIHTKCFTTSSQKNKTHSWLYVINGSAKLIDSGLVNKIKEGDSLLLTTSRVVVEVESSITKVLEICLSVDENKYEKFMRIEALQLASSHGKTIFERIYNDSQPWF